MLSFYPGPSQVVPETGDYMIEALDSGILSMNHRSEPFMKLLAKTKKVIYKKLEVPPDYEILFTSSATECWEIIAQSLTVELSYHIFNGAFGEKWFNYTRKIHSKTVGLKFDPEIELSPANLDFSQPSSVLCLTHNETSNGTRLKMEVMQLFREAFPEPLIAVDATSSMAGDLLDFQLADVWFASVQKCFGLPSGMGIMILSPRAIERAYQIGDNKYYNSLPFMLENFRKNQTPYTPNILSIYLLYRTLQDRASISKVNNQLRKRHEQLEKVISKQTRFAFLIKNAAVRSVTVTALESTPKNVKSLKKTALEHGFLLGNGYGEWKESTVRIANFPAITRQEWKELRDFLRSTLAGDNS
ncbi:aminotransferase class V-fold PLP-dependent enzyme [Fulvivirga sedimenti]|uniref:phosphoserine transaminase n=1 Tax=Fulvivirga sedimenti TaxID=2879465 RepID=A0A9X1HL56_9BACT|nr:aminotransferase class V-fold PLP-dependent enzyme [Fulvivirga sedimenti]MCA6074010.1 aminotransferase class V-fold PLP-dependent enzyme [Fulvivirga sedimenti]